MFILLSIIGVTFSRLTDEDTRNLSHTFVVDFVKAIERRGIDGHVVQHKLCNVQRGHLEGILVTVDVTLNSLAQYTRSCLL